MGQENMLALLYAVLKTCKALTFSKPPSVSDTDLWFIYAAVSVLRSSDQLCGSENFYRDANATLGLQQPINKTNH